MENQHTSADAPDGAPAGDAGDILVINGGSSSVKFALFHKEGSGDSQQGTAAPRCVFEGSVPAGTDAATIAKEIKKKNEQPIGVIGHRIVHGGPDYYRSVRIDDALIDALRDLEPFDPQHLPEEIRLVESFRAQFPNALQVACFDTAFHHDLPRVAQIIPIPRKYEPMGVRKYGFHGLSYTFLMKELARTYGAGVAHGRVVLAHLGSGASMAAVREGKPVDTTMAFTPASGIPMSSRAGDLDPGLMEYLSRKEGMTPAAWNEMVSSASGLLGIAETTADMKVLIENEARDPRAKDAVDYFCYRVAQQIGAYAATMGGIDTLVFAGGMGDQAPVIRARVCERLAFLGIELDPAKNEVGNANAAGESHIISKEDAASRVLVMHTDEAAVIAEEAYNVSKGQ